MKLPTQLPGSALVPLAESAAVPDPLVVTAIEYARERLCGDGQEADTLRFEHALGTLAVLTEVGVDAQAQCAGMLFGAPERMPLREIQARFGPDVLRLVESMRKIRRLREIHRAAQENDGRGDDAQIEILRRMTMAMSVDIRVVLIRLASRLQTLRHNALVKQLPEPSISRETLDVLAPLANRLGLWQVKWELEDLAFRFLWPDAYRRLASALEEKRIERESFVRDALDTLRSEISRAGIGAELSGRPKHLFSIWNKMRSKGLALPQIRDLRGLRVIVEKIDDCYAALGVIHGIWQAVPEEYDDYISRPKPNGYRSLHTVVVASDGRPLEIQIRSREMHRFAEYGVAAHWRYKEGRRAGADEHDEQVAWLRQLLAWQREVGQNLGSGAALPTPGEPSIFVLTPQARVIELPPGATPVDFAYHVHSALGHRCRGARVDGAMVPLSTPLANGQTVEIVAAKQGSVSDGPSRDWLNPQLGFVRSTRARAKVRQWFNAQDIANDAALGRDQVERALQREGRSALAHDELARRLGFDDTIQLFLGVARDEVGPRQLEQAVRSTAGAAMQSASDPDSLDLVRTPASEAGPEPGRDRVLVVGVDALMTQLAKCCRPAPPDSIAGYVTRGRGVSVHRQDCASFLLLVERDPERQIETSWNNTSAFDGDGRPVLYPVGIEINARDREALLRDISDVLAKLRTNVLSVTTRNRVEMGQPRAMMRFTVEVRDTGALESVLSLIRRVDGVEDAHRV